MRSLLRQDPPASRVVLRGLRQPRASRTSLPTHPQKLTGRAPLPRSRVLILSGRSTNYPPRRSIVLRRWTNDGLRSATESTGARSSVGVLSQVVMIQPSARRPRGGRRGDGELLQPAAACPRPSRVRRPKQLRIPIVRSSNGPNPPLTPRTRAIDPHRKQGHHDDTAGQAAKRICHLFLQHTPTTQCVDSQTSCHVGVR